MKKIIRSELKYICKNNNIEALVKILQDAKAKISNFQAKVSFSEG